MLVVLGIIGILTSLGIASYSSYNASQVLQSNAENVATELAYAKSRAISQVIPTSCGSISLTGYEVDVVPNSQQYTLSAICGSPRIISTDNLPSQIRFSTGTTKSVLFAVSTGIPSATATIQIDSYGGTNSVAVKVNTAGTISIQPD